MLCPTLNRHKRNTDVSQSSSFKTALCHLTDTTMDVLQSDAFKDNQQFKDTNRIQEPGSMTFESSWELPQFIANVPDKRENLLNTLTLTGFENTVYVATCGSYIRSRYGEAGIDMLRKVIDALEDDNGTYGERKPRELKSRHERHDFRLTSIKWIIL